MNNQNEQERIKINFFKESENDPLKEKRFKYSNNSLSDGGFAAYDCILDNLFQNNPIEYDSSKKNTNHTEANRNTNMKHHPGRMNYDVDGNFPKVSRSITDDSEKTMTNILDSKKEKSGFNIPWKRAEINPSIVIKGTEIHLNPIQPNITQEDLYTNFKRFGDIIHIRIIPRKEKGNSFAFIRFGEVQAAERALCEKATVLNVSSLINLGNSCTHHKEQGRN